MNLEILRQVYADSPSEEFTPITVEEFVALNFEVVSHAAVSKEVFLALIANRGPYECLLLVAKHEIVLAGYVGNLGMQGAPMFCDAYLESSKHFIPPCSLRIFYKDGSSTQYTMVD